MKLIQVILIMFLFLPVVDSVEPQPTDMSPVLRFIQQEELKTRSEMKQYMDTSLKNDRDETQQQIDYNRAEIMKELNSNVRGWIFKLGIIWFIATLTAMICYRFILMQVKRKFIKKGLRTEYYGR